ncbi:MAG: protease inhibitor I42 family protein [Nanoarchaeota archaeon]
MNQVKDIKRQTIDAKVGKQFTIELESFGTTGYSWYPLFNSDEIKTLNQLYEGRPVARRKFKYSPGISGILQRIKTNIPCDFFNLKIPRVSYSSGLAGVAEHLSDCLPRKPIIFDRTSRVFFDFATLKDGTFEINFEYKRIWEKNEQPVKRETYVINCRP